MFNVGDRVSLVYDRSIISSELVRRSADTHEEFTVVCTMHPDSLDVRDSRDILYKDFSPKSFKKVITIYKEYSRRTYA